MKLLIVDDHVLFREGLKLLLEQLDPSVEITDAGDLDAAFTAVQQHGRFDLVLLDLGLPHLLGLQALIEFRRRNESLPVVVLSGSADRLTAIGALEHGAMGFIPKTIAPDALCEALKTVLAGGICLPLAAMDAAHLAAGPHRLALKRLSELGLTQRQREVFKMIIQGRPNKLIARELGVTESTIKAHVKPILKALNVSSRVGAILEVGRLGMVLD